MNKTIEIGILDLYGGKADLSKDPGMLATGLNATFLTLNDEVLKESISLKKIVLSIHNLYDVAFWRSLKINVIIFYSNFKPQNTRLVKILKQSGKKIIIKADSDGTLGYPIKPRYVNVVSWKRNPCRWIGRNIKWSIPNSHFVLQKIEQIQDSDAVVIESPQALDNIAYILSYWGRQELISKLYIIPNPIRNKFVTIPLICKQNIVVSSGRYTDSDIKNTKVLIDTLIRFLQIRSDYRAIIIGDIDNDYRLNIPPALKNQIIFKGWLNDEKIANILSTSKIFFHPSKLESFCLAAGEAACMGNSIVGGSLEPLRYLSRNEEFGTVAYNFGESAMLGALLEDSIKWDRGVYQWNLQANFWRDRLNTQTISQQFLTLVQSIL